MPTGGRAIVVCGRDMASLRYSRRLASQLVEGAHIVVRPVALCDKPLIRSLSLDESVLCDRFQYTVICSILYVERLANVSKKMVKGRTAEKEVPLVSTFCSWQAGNLDVHQWSERP